MKKIVINFIILTSTMLTFIPSTFTMGNDYPAKNLATGQKNDDYDNEDELIARALSSFSLNAAFQKEAEFASKDILAQRNIFLGTFRQKILGVTMLTHEKQELAAWEKELFNAQFNAQFDDQFDDQFDKAQLRKAISNSLQSSDEEKKESLSITTAPPLAQWASDLSQEKMQDDLNTNIFDQHEKNQKSQSVSLQEFLKNKQPHISTLEEKNQ